ncbi:MAG: VWA domain-containing protein [Bryobacteraceae bacterium]
MLTRRKMLISGLSAGLPLFGQEQSDKADFKDTTFNVIAPVTVIDRDNNYVNGLESRDFTLLDNGKLQEIKVDVSFIPISMVVAVQANSVVEPMLPAIKKIGPLLENLVIGEQGEAAILKFDHRIQEIQSFTNDGKLFTKALNSINPGSSTSAMIDTVFQATRMLRNRPKNHRRILLLISETQDKGSEGRIREAMLSAEVNNVIIYSININRAITTLLKKPDIPRQSNIPPGARPLPPGAPITQTSVDQLTGYGNVIPVFQEIFTQVKYVLVKNPLEVFTKYTGGREFSFLNQRTLEQVVSQIGEELHSQYLLSYRPSQDVRAAGGWHSIKVQVNRPHTKARTRDGYWMAAKFD